MTAGMNCPASKWIVSNTSIKATLEGLFTKATATNSKGEHTSVGGGQVWFTGLSPGSNYTVALFYEREGRVDTQCEHNLTLGESLGKMQHTAVWSVV